MRRAMALFVATATLCGCATTPTEQSLAVTRVTGALDLRSFDTAGLWVSYEIENHGDEAARISSLEHVIRVDGNDLIRDARDAGPTIAGDGRASVELAQNLSLSDIARLTRGEVATIETVVVAQTPAQRLPVIGRWSARVPRLLAPRFIPKMIAIRDVSALSAILGVTITLENPNPGAFHLERLEVDLSLAGIPAARIEEGPLDLLVPPESVTDLELTARVRLTAGAESLYDVLRRATHTECAFRGRARFAFDSNASPLWASIEHTQIVQIER